MLLPRFVEKILCEVARAPVASPQFRDIFSVTYAALFCHATDQGLDPELLMDTDD
jgi:hypothetical protein